MAIPARSTKSPPLNYRRHDGRITCSTIFAIVVGLIAVASGLQVALLRNQLQTAETTNRSEKVARELAEQELEISRALESKGVATPEQLSGVDIYVLQPSPAAVTSPSRWVVLWNPNTRLGLILRQSTSRKTHEISAQLFATTNGENSTLSQIPIATRSIESDPSRRWFLLPATEPLPTRFTIKEQRVNQPADVTIFEDLERP